MMSRGKAAVERRPGESSQGQDRAGALSLKEQSGPVCSLTVHTVDGSCRTAHRRRIWKAHPVDGILCHVRGQRYIQIMKET